MMRGVPELWRVYVRDIERGAADGSLSQPTADSGEGGKGAGDGEGRPSDEPGEPDEIFHRAPDVEVSVYFPSV